MTDPVQRGRGSTGAGALSRRDKVRRLLIGLAVVVCAAVVVVGAASVREVDSEGDVIEERDDPNEVEISGDSSLVAEHPPGAALGGPSESEIVEQTIPAEGAEILRQAQIGIDLGAVYDVRSLSVQGVAVPEEELIRRPELNQVFFQPAEGFTFESLPAGRVCARADVVRLSEPDDVIRAVEWCFEVT